MSLAGVATVFNEEDIIEQTVRHHFAEGFDRILIADASTDQTPEILAELSKEFDLRVIRDDTGKHYQPRWINWLAQQAGCDWIVPFDADEFWYSPTGKRIVDALEDVPAGVTKLPARMFQHRDWEHRYPHPAPFPKVAFRWTPQMVVANGNHDVSGPGAALWGVLDLRELQFRSFEHLCVKSRDRVVRIDPSLPESEGAHQRVLHALSLEERRAAWADMQARETVFDPISNISTTS